LITEREEEAAREMCMTAGWKHLMEELEDQLDLCTLDACNTLEDLHFTKGRAAVIRMLLNYESYITRLGEEEEDYGLQ
jgi:hypothetical protein